MATPNRGYTIPTTTKAATVPADLGAALLQVDADMQETIDRVGQTESVGEATAGTVEALGETVQTVQGEVAANGAELEVLGDRVGTVETDVAALQRGAGLGVQAADLLAARLGTGAGDMVVGVAGDSTANDAGDWPRVMCSMLAARHPALRVEHYQWDDAASAYSAPAIVQAGEGEPAFSGTVLRDTFTRTTGIATPDQGGPWVVMTPANWVLDGSKATTTGVARLRADVGARDFTSTLALVIDTTPTAASQTLRTYHGDAANGVYTQITVNTGGAAILYVFRVENAVSTQLASVALSTLGIANNGGTGTVTVKVEGAIQNYRVTATVGSQSWSHQFTISETVYGAMGTFLDVFPQSAMSGIGVSDALVEVAERPATYQTLTVKAGTKGGGTLDYQVENWEGMFGDEESTPGTPPTPGGTGQVTARDTFTRTGPLAGSTADTGEAWTGAAAWATDGSSAVPSTFGSAYLAVPNPPTVRFDLSVVTATPANHTIRLGVSSRGDATNGVYVGVGVTTAGAFNPSAYVRTPTGGFRDLGSIAGHGVAPGTATAQQVPVTVVRDGTSFTVTVGAATATFAVTPAEAAELGTLVELQGATPDQGSIRVTELAATYTATLPPTPGTPPVAGSPLDVLVVAHGHNYGQQDGGAYQARLDEFAAFVSAHRPSTKLLIASQNPEFAPAASPVQHAVRQAAARLWARRNGHSYAPVFEHFHAQPDQGQAWVLADGIHPTPSPGGVPADGTGGTEWARIIVDTITQ